VGAPELDYWGAETMPCPLMLVSCRAVSRRRQEEEGIKI